MVRFDIRVADTAALSGAGDIEYVAALSDCSSLFSVQVGNVDHLDAVDLTDFQPTIGTSSGCFTNFVLPATVNNTQPAISVTDAAGDQYFTESFTLDQNLPSLSFESVEITGEAGNQILSIHVNADDDTDITYLSFNVTGLSASDLRTVGGVIAEAKNTAFVSTQSMARVYPSADSQTLFTYSIPLVRELSAEEIAFDAVILADVSVVDASGNHMSLSKVAFTAIRSRRRRCR